MASRVQYYNVLPWKSVGLLRHCGDFWKLGVFYSVFHDSQFTYIYHHTGGSTASIIDGQEPTMIPFSLTGQIMSLHEHNGHIYCITSSGIVGRFNMTTTKLVIQVHNTNFTFEKIGKLAFCDRVLKSCPLTNGSAAIVEYMDSLWLRIYCNPPIEGYIDPGVTIGSRFGHKLLDENKRYECHLFLLHEVLVSEMTKELKRELFPLMNPLTSNILIMCDPRGGIYHICTRYVNEGLGMIYAFPTHVLCVSLIKQPNHDKHYGLCFALSTGSVFILSGRFAKNAISRNTLHSPLNSTKSCAITKTGDILASDGTDCYLCRTHYNGNYTMSFIVMIAVKGISGLHLLENDRIHAMTKCGVPYVITTSLINETVEYNWQLKVTDRRYSLDDVKKLYEDVQKCSKGINKEEMIQNALSLASRCDYVAEHVKPIISVYSECDLAFEDKNCRQHVIDVKILIDDPLITIEGNIFELIVKILRTDKKEWTRKFQIDNQITHKNPLRISFRIEFTELDLIHGIPVNCQFSFSTANMPLVIMPLNTVYLDISYFYTPTNDRTCKKSKLSAVDTCLNSLYGEAIPNETKIFQFSCPDNSLKLINVLNDLFSNATHRFPSSFLQQFEGIENGTCFVRIQNTIVRIELYEATTAINGALVEGKHLKVEGDNKELTLAVKMNIVSKIVKKVEDISVDGNIIPSLWKLERDMQIMRLQKQPAKDFIPLMDNLGIHLFL